jgi:hypothetical protein
MKRTRQTKKIEEDLAKLMPLVRLQHGSVETHCCCLLLFV